MDNVGKPDIISPVTYSEEGNILENPTLKSVRKGLDCHEMFLESGVLHNLDRWRAKHPSGSLDISGALRSTREKRTRRRSPQDMSVDVSFFMFLRWARLEAATGSRTGLHVLVVQSRVRGGHRSLRDKHTLELNMAKQYYNLQNIYFEIVTTTWYSSNLFFMISQVKELYSECSTHEAVNIMHITYLHKRCMNYNYMHNLVICSGMFKFSKVKVI